MRAVYSLYPNPDQAQQAVEGLRAAGVAERDITVISSEPFEEYEFSHRDAATWLYYFAGFGGLVGLAIGISLTVYTEVAWPLPTGGMPIVAWWPNLVVIFELTMLGAILSTVITLFIAGPLRRTRPHLHDPEVMDGLILVGVEGPASVPLETVQTALGAMAGGRVKTVA